MLFSPDLDHASEVTVLCSPTYVKGELTLECSYPMVRHPPRLPINVNRATVSPIDWSAMEQDACTFQETRLAFATKLGQWCRSAVPPF